MSGFESMASQRPVQASQAHDLLQLLVPFACFKFVELRITDEAGEERVQPGTSKLHARCGPIISNPGHIDGRSIQIEDIEGSRMQAEARH